MPFQIGPFVRVVGVWHGLAPADGPGMFGAAGSLCHGEANDGKRLNDDYQHRINQNNRSAARTEAPQMFAEGFGGLIRVVYKKIIRSFSTFISPCTEHLCVNWICSQVPKHLNLDPVGKIHQKLNN